MTDREFREHELRELLAMPCAKWDEYIKALKGQLAVSKALGELQETICPCGIQLPHADACMSAQA
jgi:hypothetical protein